MEKTGHLNRLATESSPYLLQHQHNPVDWYPWGPEAFEASRAQNKPIFLSVGYSTCYWCHVMERQSFEISSIAREMNERFINIKVDREERPDVDQLYMTAVQLLTHHGGWPMSVFLMPDLRPFYGGTYFPPEDAHGRPGFVTVLRALEDAYKNRKSDVEQTATQIKSVLQQLAEPAPPDGPISIDRHFVEALVERSTSDYEPTYGGFGSAPKFPRETLLELLLTYLAQPTLDLDPQSLIANRRSAIRKKLLHTLDALAAGGIRDQLGGGFHRYSTDAKWLVPHFEIMLYDNAMLAWCYIEAFRQTNDQKYADVARGIFDFVLREMTSPDGSFYTAFDAEVDGQEGLNYLWTSDEIERVLGPDDAKVFNRIYGVDRGPNFADPHHGNGVPDKNILHLAVPMESELMQKRIAEMRQQLLNARQQRKQPLLDTKILTSWNALMIRALAHGGQILREPRYLNAAVA
nr:thioredoxin domain-containing protein [Gemmatimonadota bacterium]